MTRTTGSSLPIILSNTVPNIGCCVAEIGECDKKRIFVDTFRVLTNTCKYSLNCSRGIQLGSDFINHVWFRECETL